MHVLFNDINVNGKEIREIEHREVPKKFELGFEIGIPVNETHFSKTIFSRKLMLILVNINGNRHRQKRCVFQNYNMNTNYNRKAVCSFCRSTMIFN